MAVCRKAGEVTSPEGLPFLSPLVLVVSIDAPPRSPANFQKFAVFISSLLAIMLIRLCGPLISHQIGRGGKTRATGAYAEERNSRLSPAVALASRSSRGAPRLHPADRASGGRPSVV